MGITVDALRALHVAARLYGVDFRRTVMLGRQKASYDEVELAAVIRKPLALAGDGGTEGYSEGLFRLLGAEVVDSVDASGYEGASIVADFNKPLPADHHGAYSLYCDFGSMEHIFNVSQVVRNAADLLASDGHLLVVTNCNGFPNHGLYQFTPEFFYSTFSSRNGFQRTAVFLVDVDGYGRWAYVRNPSSTGVRTRMSRVGTWAIVCLAQKARESKELQVQQSDYEHGRWQAKAPSAVGVVARRRRRRYPLKPLVRRIRQANLRLRDALGLGPDLVPINVETISHNDFWRLVDGHPSITSTDG